MAKVQVNSDAASGTVAKLAYRKRDPYEIIEATGFGANLVRCHGQPTAPLLKCPTQALSPLPPAIDTPDLRYLNHSHAPLIDSLRTPFQIQIYNNMWFPSSLPTDHLPLFKFRDVAGTVLLLLPFHQLLDLLFPFLLLLLSQSFLPMTSLFQLSRLLPLPFLPPFLFRKIASFLSLTVLPALFDLAGTSYRSTYLNPFLLLPIALLTVDTIADTSLPDPTCCWWLLYGIASLLLLQATSTSPNLASYIACADVFLSTCP